MDVLKCSASDLLSDDAFPFLNITFLLCNALENINEALCNMFCSS